MSAPNRLHMVRNGISVTSSMGARTTARSISILPIFMGATPNYPEFGWNPNSLHQHDFCGRGKLIRIHPHEIDACRDLQPAGILPVPFHCPVAGGLLAAQ